MEIRVVRLRELILAYLRFREWMDHDAEHSAFCAKEIIVMQALFGTAYITVPDSLAKASYEELLVRMAERQEMLCEYTAAVYESPDADSLRVIGSELEKHEFRSKLYYFTPMHQAIMQAAMGATQNVAGDPGDVAIDEESIEDHFRETNQSTIARIRAQIVADHPGIESVAFPVEKLRALGLPKPSPFLFIDHVVH